jgi:hypothetical protein
MKIYSTDIKIIVVPFPGREEQLMSLVHEIRAFLKGCRPESIIKKIKKYESGKY